ncbi:hypothetical protein BT96DRAFT_1071907 [Gymnopus androsaceus JB14]|uniref:Uncharacterized protein n=1 Tax=Gymnopus androsaceus JB14 TaxID=1447944 RepID=A0A6A4GTY5_9AGAR|nr:hypothetical protein BT96DRAFT_1071907 [Gymnopus androsaceus JB14]
MTSRSIPMVMGDALDILAALDEAEWSDTIDYFELHKGLPLHYDVDEDEDQKEMEAEEYIEDNDDSNKNGDGEMREVSEIVEDTAAESMVKASPLRHLHFIITKIISSPQHCQSFGKILCSKYTKETNVHKQKLMIALLLKEVNLGAMHLIDY